MNGQFHCTKNAWEISVTFLHDSYDRCQAVCYNSKYWTKLTVCFIFRSECRLQFKVVLLGRHKKLCVFLIERRL